MEIYTPMVVLDRYGQLIVCSYISKLLRRFLQVWQRKDEHIVDPVMNYAATAILIVKDASDSDLSVVFNDELKIGAAIAVF